MPRTASACGVLVNTMNKWVKFLIAVLLLPTVVFAVAAVGRIFIQVFGEGKAALCFFGGAVYGLSGPPIPLIQNTCFDIRILH